MSHHETGKVQIKSHLSCTEQKRHRSTEKELTLTENDVKSLNLRQRVPARTGSSGLEKFFDRLFQRNLVQELHLKTGSVVRDTESPRFDTIRTWIQIVRGQAYVPTSLLYNPFLRALILLQWLEGTAFL